MFAVVVVVVYALGNGTSSTNTPTPAPAKEVVVRSISDSELLLDVQKQIPGAADTIVWRFCSRMIAGELEDSFIMTVGSLDSYEPSFEDEYAKRIAESVRLQVMMLPQVDLYLVQALGDECRAWRKADFQQ